MTWRVLLRVSAPHFVAGYLCNREGTCVEAAPILRWAIGKKGDYLGRYFARKRWIVETVKVFDD